MPVPEAGNRTYVREGPHGVAGRPLTPDTPSARSIQRSIGRGPPFLENTHALSGFERRMNATRITLRAALLPGGDIGWTFGVRHKSEIHHVEGAKRRF